VIELITGLPGHGKTLYALAKYRDLPSQGRPVYHSGIRGLRLPWAEHPVDRWEDLPPGSVFVVDEAQFKFPTRGRGEPPEWIARLAVHRHGGRDLVLITQHPMLIDSFVRRLVDRHFHVVRKFGTRWATVHEQANGCKDNVDKSRAGMIPHEWRYPADVFALYDSAELHTVKRRIPARVFVLAAIPVVLLGITWFLWQRWTARGDGELVPGSAPAASAPAGGSAGPLARGVGGIGGSGDRLTPAEFAITHTPRVAGLAYTAPVYDEVTRPVQAPYPAACIATMTRCSCYSQQGTRLEVPLDLCRSLAGGGFFVAWQQPAEARPGPVAALSPPAPAVGGVSGIAGSYGLDKRGSVPPVPYAGTAPPDSQPSARPKSPLPTGSTP
jgi:zona occludens toxin